MQASAAGPPSGTITFGCRRLPHRCSVNRQSPPKVLEPINGQFGIADGVLDVFMTEVVLQRTSIVAIVRQLVSAGVPEHVRVDAKWHLGRLAEALEALRVSGLWGGGTGASGKTQISTLRPLRPSFS